MVARGPLPARTFFTGVQSVGANRRGARRVVRALSRPLSSLRKANSVMAISRPWPTATRATS